MSQKEDHPSTPSFPLVDDDMKEQLNELALHAKNQAAHASPTLSTVEVGDVPEDELERVDRDTFRPASGTATEQVIQYLALQTRMQVTIAQKKPGFFAEDGKRLPIHWSVILVLGRSGSHGHDHSHVGK